MPNQTINTYRCLCFSCLFFNILDFFVFYFVQDLTPSWTKSQTITYQHIQQNQSPIPPTHREIHKRHQSLIFAQTQNIIFSKEITENTQHQRNCQVFLSCSNTTPHRTVLYNSVKTACYTLHTDSSESYNFSINSLQTQKLTLQNFTLNTFFFACWERLGHTDRQSSKLICNWSTNLINLAIMSPVKLFNHLPILQDKQHWSTQLQKSDKDYFFYIVCLFLYIFICLFMENFLYPSLSKVNRLYTVWWYVPLFYHLFADIHRSQLVSYAERRVSRAFNHHRWLKARLTFFGPKKTSFYWF